MTIINQDAALLRSAIEVMDKQRLYKRDVVHSAIKTTTVPMPDEIVEALCQINIVDAHTVLRDHPGYALREKKQSYLLSLKVFERSVQDLLCAIQEFEELSRDGSIFNRTHDAELDEIELGIQKDLFAAANAAHALVDHSTRQFQKTIKVSDFDQRRKECFGNDGLHEFVIGLRTILHHVRMVRTGWELRQRRSDGGHEASFMLDKVELLLAFGDKVSAPIKQYLASAPERIDLRQVFDEYRRRAREFHSWFSAEIQRCAPESLTDFERCQREVKNSAIRMTWKAILGNWLNWPTHPNPYKHLKKYLTPDQMVEVYKLPMRSPEQVDKVVEYIDQDGACDDELRGLAVALFRRSKKHMTPLAWAREWWWRMSRA